MNYGCEGWADLPGASQYLVLCCRRGCISLAQVPRVLSERPNLRPFWRLKVVYRYPGSAYYGRRHRGMPVVLALAEAYSSGPMYPEPFKPQLCELWPKLARGSQMDLPDQSRCYSNNLHRIARISWVQRELGAF